MTDSRFAPPRSRRRPAVGVALLALVFAGCAGRGNVSGKVTYQGKPLVFGTILIEASDGSAQQGNIGKDGSYSVNGVATGAARVAVNSPNPKGITLIYKDPSKKQPPFPDAPGWFAIPKQYESTATSELTYKIKRGENTIDIELK